MPAQPLTRRRLSQLATCAVVATGAMGGARAQSPRPVRIRATIDAVQGHDISMTARSGQSLVVSFASDTAIIAIVPIKLEEIKPGSFIGAAAMPRPDGTQRALEVHVFPESMRGTGEGHRPFDLQPRSTMTNGTVGAVTGTAGRKLTVTYQDGEKTIVVPPDIPIVTFEPGSPALLTAGAHVIVMGIEETNGQLSATRILVGKDGLVPPM
jgi:hypothetical protein